MFKFIVSSICSAFQSVGIGSRVLDPGKFLDAVEKAVEGHDVSKDRVPGQHYILLPDGMTFVSAGVGKRTQVPEDYVVRANRGQVNAYLRRDKASPVEGLAVVVYTKAAYVADSDLQKPEMAAELERVAASDCTHVVVSVLASAGPRSPLTPDRFLKNLAGGNKEAGLWTGDEIRVKAAEIAAYYGEWCVVAD